MYKHYKKNNRSMRQRLKNNVHISRKLYGGSSGSISQRTTNEQLFGTEHPFDTKSSIIMAETYFRKVQQIIRNFNYMLRNPEKELPNNPDDIEVTEADEYQITNTSPRSTEAQWKKSIKTLESSIAQNGNVMGKLLYMKEQILPMYENLDTFRSQITPRMNEIYETYKDVVKKPYILTIENEYITVQLINIITAWIESIDTTSDINTYELYNLGRFSGLFTQFYSLCIIPTIQKTPLQTNAFTIAKYLEAQYVLEKLLLLMKKLVIKFYTKSLPGMISVLHVNTVRLINIIPDLFTNARLAIMRFDDSSTLVDLPPAGKKMIPKPKSRSRSSSSSSSSKSGSISNTSVHSICKRLDIKGYSTLIQKRITDLCSEIDSIKQQLVRLDPKSSSINKVKHQMFRNAVKQKLQMIRNLITMNRHM